MANQLNNRLYGAHVSSAGGLSTTIDRGSELGCTAIQSFATSPRSIKFKQIEAAELDAYKQKREQSAIRLHVFHGVYLINLAHTKPEYVKVCVKSLKYYQWLAGEIGGLGTVFHVGSHKGLGLDKYLDQITQALIEVLESSPKGVYLILEMAAGQKGTIGQTVEELATLFGWVEKRGGNTDQLAIGIDTQHAFASGYNLASDEGVNRLINEIEINFGLKRLKVIHLNDSATPLSSMKDRHANLGEGLIGKIGLKQVVNHPKLTHVPIILEVPGEKAGPRRADVEALKQLMGMVD